MSAPDEATDPTLLSDAALEAELGCLLAAADRDALTDPLSLARHLDPDRMVTRPHLRVISDAFAGMAANPNARLLILTPPQVGKTETAAVWGPFWWLCRNPRQRVIIGSYASHLATKRGRSVRRLVQTYGDRFGLHLERGSSAANDWTLTEGGGIRSVGVGAGVTGMPGECVSGGTEIMTTAGLLTVAEFCQLPDPPLVMSWSHEHHRTEFRRVEATRALDDRPVLDVITATGRRLTCTPEHLIYSPGRGYIPAGELRPGDELLGAGDVPALPGDVPQEALGGGAIPPALLRNGLPERRPAGGRSTSAVRAVPHGVPSHADEEAFLLTGLRLSVRAGRADLRAVRNPLHPAQEHAAQGPQTRLGADVLLGDVPPGRQHRPRRAQQAPVCALRRSDGTRQREDVLLGNVPSCRVRGDAGMPALRDVVRDALVGTGQGAAPEPRTPVLLAGLRGSGAHGGGERGLPGVPDRPRPPGAPLLHGRLQTGRSERAAPPQHVHAETLPGVRDRVPAQEFPAHLLLTDVRGHGPFDPDDRAGQLPVQGRHLLRPVVPADAADDPSARRAQVPGLRGRQPHDRGQARGQGQPPHVAGDPPHQRGPGRQPAGEPDRLVPAVPHGPPQVRPDTVSVVRRVRGARERVYDLQVEVNSNFFAGEILVHNCLIIDDPHKGRAEAESPRIRETVWEWWSGDLVSRLAPGAPVCVIQTRWHEDDLAGRLLAEEGSFDEGGRWKVVHLPALALPPDEATGIGPDGLGRGPGEPLTHPRIPTRDTAALAGHWAEKRRSSTPRDWGALYLGTPKPVEGALVSREVLRRQRDYRPAAEAVKRAVSIDPSGGGRSTAGIIGCWLGDDGRLYFSHDRTGVMSSLEWSEAACRLAYELDADRFIIENNYGGDMAERVIRSAWKDLVGRGEIDQARLIPRVVPQQSRAGKVLRAEPVAGQFPLDRIRFAAPMPEVEEEWATWQDGSPDSPGRIDASVHAALNLLPIPNSGQLVSNPTAVSRASVAGSGASGMPIIPRGGGGAPSGTHVVPDFR